MICNICKDTGILHEGMYEINYCGCKIGEKKYNEEVKNALCQRCQGTGRFETNNGSIFNCYCDIGESFK